MPASFGERYQFGEFELDTTELVLRRNDQLVSLTPKALQVLTFLVRNSGRVVWRKAGIRVNGIEPPGDDAGFQAQFGVDANEQVLRRAQVYVRVEHRPAQ